MTRIEFQGRILSELTAQWGEWTKTEIKAMWNACAPRSVEVMEDAIVRVVQLGVNVRFKPDVRAIVEAYNGVLRDRAALTRQDEHRPGPHDAAALRIYLRWQLAFLAATCNMDKAKAYYEAKTAFAELPGGISEDLAARYDATINGYMEDGKVETRNEVALQGVPA